MECILNLFSTFNGAWNDSEKDMPPTAVFLPGESHGEEPGRLQSMRSQRVRLDWRYLVYIHGEIAVVRSRQILNSAPGALGQIITPFSLQAPWRQIKESDMSVTRLKYDVFRSAFLSRGSKRGPVSFLIEVVVITQFLVVIGLKFPSLCWPSTEDMGLNLAHSDIPKQISY